MQAIEVKTKSDITTPFSSFTGYRFVKGDLYADVWLSWHHNVPEFEITYWRIGNSCAVEFASHCKSERSVISKVAKFLNVK